MKNTPQQVAQSLDYTANWKLFREWLLQATAKEIHECIHHLPDNAGVRFEYAKAALQVRLSDEQLQAAKILERQTGQLIGLTRALVWLTVGLLIFTVLLAVREYRPNPQNEHSQPSHKSSPPAPP